MFYLSVDSHIGLWGQATQSWRPRLILRIGKRADSWRGCRLPGLLANTTVLSESQQPLEEWRTKGHTQLVKFCVLTAHLGPGKFDTEMIM